MTARGVLALCSLLVMTGCTTTQPATSDVPRIDFHQHLVSPRFAPIVGYPEADGAALVARLDQAGIRRAVVLSMGYSLADERKALPDPASLTRQENDWTSRQVAASSGRLIGFCGVNPLRPEALDEIDRCLDLPGMRGLKLHFGNSGITLRDPAHVRRMADVFALADRRRAPILAHLRARGGRDYGAPDAQLFIDELLPRAPHVDVVVAHFGGSGPGYPEQADEVMAVFADAADRRDVRLRRVYFDVATIVTADSSAEDGARIRRRIRQLGAGRVLYGSDLGAPGAPDLAAGWRLFREVVGLDARESRAIATNVPPFARR